MIKYYQSFENGLMHIKESDTKYGVREYHNPGYSSSVFIYDGAVIINELFDSVEAAIKDLDGYSKKVKLPDGSMEIPLFANYPKMETVLVPWTPGIEEIWPGEDEKNA